MNVISAGSVVKLIKSEGDHSKIILSFGRGPRGTGEKSYADVGDIILVLEDIRSLEDRDHDDDLVHFIGMHNDTVQTVLLFPNEFSIVQ